MEGSPGRQPPHNAENDMRSLGFLFHAFSLDGVSEKPGTWNYQQTRVNKQVLEKLISRKHDLAKQNTFLFTESYASQTPKEKPALHGISVAGGELTLHPMCQQHGEAPRWEVMLLAICLPQRPPILVSGGPRGQLNFHSPTQQE